MLASETVTIEFTGLVHTAPGHGPEDFDIGREHGLEPFSPIDDGGRFTADGGKYKGVLTKDANDLIIDDLTDKGLLFHRDDLVHRYGHCWRCSTPIVYRATDQWFVRVTELKETMLSEVQRVQWTPEWAGSARQYDWVYNAKDWTISRQRYWGIPLPIWRCPQNHMRVVGSTEELAAGEGYEEGMDLHRPWIDGVQMPCDECAETMSRISDVLDVWFDSAICSWASLGYPKRREEFELWWPSPWITEAHDQTRGWFYSQLGAGVVAFDRCPYDSVLMHGWIWPEEGEAFSKSRGGNITPGDVAEKYGRDALRLYELKAAPPWDDFAFLWDEVRNSQRTLNILWNVHRFSTLYMSLDAFDSARHPMEDLRKGMPPEDRWMLSRLQAAIAEVNQGMSSYELHRAARALEDLIVRDLSRWYVRLIRDRTWVEGETQEKLSAYRVLYDALLGISRLLAPMAPFIAEAIYQDLGGPQPTVHMEDWPTADPDLRDETLEQMMATARVFVEEVSRLRQSRNYKLRWPVARVILVPRDSAAREALEEMREILLGQMNSRELEVLNPGEVWSELDLGMSPVQPVLGKRYKALLPAILETLSKADPEEVREAVERGSYEVEIKGKPIQITGEMVGFEHRLPKGFDEGSTSSGTVYVDFRLTPGIEAEGYARELVRRVQQMRKDLDLSVEDYVRTEVQSSGRLQGFFQEWRGHICTETRTRDLAIVRRRPKGTLVKDWDVEKEKIIVGLAKVS